MRTKSFIIFASVFQIQWQILFFRGREVGLLPDRSFCQVPMSLVKPRLWVIHHVTVDGSRCSTPTILLLYTVIIHLGCFASRIFWKRINKYISILKLRSCLKREKRGFISKICNRRMASSEDFSVRLKVERRQPDSEQQFDLF